MERLNGLLSLFAVLFSFSVVAQTFALSFILNLAFPFFFSPIFVILPVVSLSLDLFLSSARALVVMIVACQVMDPGSIPGERNLLNRLRYYLFSQKKPGLELLGHTG